MTPGWARGLGHEVTRDIMHGAAVGGVAAVTATAGRGPLSRFIRHPLVLLTLGAVAGWYLHKYRNEIIAAASQVTDAGKDFVLSQKENLEDMVAAAHEADEAKGKSVP
jgi:hypothetical protein